MAEHLLSTHSVLLVSLLGSTGECFSFHFFDARSTYEEIQSILPHIKSRSELCPPPALLTGDPSPVLLPVLGRASCVNKGPWEACIWSLDLGRVLPPN